MINFNVELSESHMDYTLDKVERLQSLLPHLFPKLKGEWNLQLITSDINFIRQLLDANIVPEYVNLLIVVTKDVLNILFSERPSLVIEEKTVWESFQDMIAKLPCSIETRAVSLIYSNTPHNRKELKKILDQLVSAVNDSNTITVDDVKKVINVRKIYYANQVVRAFMVGDNKRWSMFRTFEQDLGRDKAYYTLRKYLSKLISEKNKYMNNEDYKDKNVEDIDTYSIVYAYNLFISNTSTYMLYPIMLNIERRFQGYANLQ